MGNLFVFRRDTDLGPIESTANVAAGSSDSKDWPEALDKEFSPNAQGERSGSWAAFRRSRLPGFARGPVNASTRADLDGYLLVLLADQEFDAGRDQQAQTLLDAAYAAFDRQMHTDAGLTVSR